jgi:hypothetical protein
MPLRLLLEQGELFVLFCPFEQLERFLILQDARLPMMFMDDCIAGTIQFMEAPESQVKCVSLVILHWIYSDLKATDLQFGRSIFFS